MHINIVSLRKENGESYTFSFRDDQTLDILRVLGRYASDQALSFSWYDAAVLSQKVRSMRKQKISRVRF